MSWRDVAEDADRPVEEAPDDAGAELAEVLLERLGLVRLEGAEEHSGAALNLSFLGETARMSKSSGMPPSPFEALAEGQAGELARVG